ncbi:hypothetical protein [Photobacterium sp. 1_MG-2023]|uniref:hypothetical protein n=1 Tax=Photobacterium sp. 1_MG-2023 TaxID=3062646 RepID=UPI0034C6BE28
MSRAELKATQETGLLRGGRDGTHYVTDSANSDALRARQRSALPQTPEVRVTLEVPNGNVWTDTLKSGAKETYSYDSDGRLSALNRYDGSKESYTYRIYLL